MVIMNFSHIYEGQDFYRKEKDTEPLWLDCTDLSGTNCYCDEAAREQIKSRMEGLGPGGIHFLDSGNYHYISKLWVEQIREPFELLVFDHHTDMQPALFGDMLSCGGWVRDVLAEHPGLTKLYMAGPPEASVLEAGPWESRYRDKICWISQEQMEDKKAWQTCLEEDTLEEQKQRRRPGLYISFDKDILDSAEVKTNWDQGTVSIKTALWCLEYVLKTRRIIGMDVCGEDEGAGQEWNERSSAVNQQLYKIFTKWTKRICKKI